MRKGKGWYATFTLLIVAVFVVIYALTGQDAIGAAARFLWNGIVLARNIVVRSAGSLLKFLAQGIGWRRLSRFLSAGATVGLGYAASVVVSDRTVEQARSWREKLHAVVISAQHKWHDAPLIAKIIAVVCLIASQIYLHVFLVIFPIAFLVPTVRRIWVRAADILFGGWYWKTFGARHRAAVASIRNLSFVRPLFEAARLTRLRYLSAWRLWRYDPRYRDPANNARHVVSLIEPWRLLRRGELDGYIGRPLLAGRRQGRPAIAAAHAL
ncbi:MAG TPA: hypothetical protein VHC71_12650 [Hyphomicrobium sp.]|nr:hypothetical protein [Hyphomicrobium sp.]